MSNSDKKLEKNRKNAGWANIQPGHGRPKGRTNKFTDLKKTFLDTFEKIEKEGGKKEAKVKTLFAWATKNDKNQGMFYQMIAKMLPSNVSLEHSGLVSVIFSDQFLPKKDDGSKPE